LVADCDQTKSDGKSDEQSDEQSDDESDEKSDEQSDEQSDENSDEKSDEESDEQSDEKSDGNSDDEESDGNRTSKWVPPDICGHSGVPKRFRTSPDAPRRSRTSQVTKSWWPIDAAMMPRVARRLFRAVTCAI